MLSSDETGTCRKNEQARGIPARLAVTIWSEIRESNPCPNLGKVMYYHYTNLAFRGRAGIPSLTLACPNRNASFANRCGRGKVTYYHYTIPARTGAL